MCFGQKWMEAYHTPLCYPVYFAGEHGQKCQLPLLPGPWTTTVWQSEQLGSQPAYLLVLRLSERRERQQDCNVRVDWIRIEGAGVST